MKTYIIAFAIAFTEFTSFSTFAQRWTKEELKDKIKGGWAGQTIGVTFGGPTEFKYKGGIIPDNTPIEWYKGYIKETFINIPGLYDDIYCDLTFVEVFEKKGLNASSADFAEAFKNTGYRLWHANQQSRGNLLAGLLPKQAGHWLNNPCADAIDFQIEADFAGLMSPGLPWRANEICDSVGHLMNSGDGYYGGVFVANMYAWAFTTKDLKAIVTNALKAIPSNTLFHQTISDVLKWHTKFPKDWKSTWWEVQKKHDIDVGDPKGIFNSYNIDARINAAYVVIGLLYGNGNWTQTLEISARCGQDSDCNPSTAAGILGVINGYSKIPTYWKADLEDVENLPFAHTTLSLNKVYELSFQHAVANLMRSGAKEKNGSISLPEIKTTTVPYEQNFVGHYPTFRSEKSFVVKPNNPSAGYSFEFTGLGYVINGDFLINEDRAIVKNLPAVLEIEEDGVIRKIPINATLNSRPFVAIYKYNMPLGKHKVTIRLQTEETGVEYKVFNHIVYGNKAYQFK